MGLRLAKRSLDRISRRIRQLTRRSGGKSLEQLCDTLNPVITGWVNYFAPAEMKSPMQDLDKHLRRRLRQVAWKQWKTTANRGTHNLHSRGVSELWAVRTAGSSKGCWRLSASPPLQQALNGSFWEQLGLKSFLQYYQFRHT